MSGKLIGVGLGPGDPELMTMKAHRLISSAHVIAYPALPGEDSFARRIASGAISSRSEEIRIDVPITVAREPAQEAYDAGAAEIAKRLKDGKDVIVLCEGDPLFFGSFMYLLARLSDTFECEVVPGVSSFTASAAAALRPLTARNEFLTVIPAPNDANEIRTRLEHTNAAVIMKVGRHLGKVRSVLEELGLLEDALYVERASLPEQRILALRDAPDPAPYFSMILVTKGADTWLR